MTRQRQYGADTPFGVWIRKQKEIDSHQHGLCVNDADWILHKYKTGVVDRIGTRDVQLAMMVEVKTNGSEPNKSQQEILFYFHQLLESKKWVKRVKSSKIMLWCYGVFVLSLEGDCPKDGELIRWGSFEADGTISWLKNKDEKALVALLGFDKIPNSPNDKFSARRHHKDESLIVTKPCELGFPIETTIHFRS